MRIKICGITNIPDALYAVELGADALGFIFYQKSPRYITPQAVRVIIDALPPFVTTVGVVVNESIDSVREILATSGCDMAQLHGDETSAYIDALARPAMKCLSIAGPEDLAPIAQFTNARAIMLDTKVERQSGGTGIAFDWHIARQAQHCGRPIVLAGGLRPENVAEAIRIAQPQAVDISSGIEAEPGKKDHQRMRQFFAAVRG